MTLAQNLAAAQAAIDTMNQHGFFASNRRADRAVAAQAQDAAAAAAGIVLPPAPALSQSNQGPLATLVSDNRDQNTPASLVVDAQGAPVGNSIGQWRQISLPDVTANVGRITASHIGNCWEQAQVAFMLVYTTCPNVRPLDLMYFRNPGYDHVWLGIGLAPGWSTVSPNRVGGRAIGRYNLRNWGAEAVWCDPWQSGGVAYAVADLIAGKVRNLDAVYKCNTAELIEEGWPGSYLRVT